MAGFAGIAELSRRVTAIVSGQHGILKDHWAFTKILWDRRLALQDDLESLGFPGNSFGQTAKKDALKVGGKVNERPILIPVGPRAPMELMESMEATGNVESPEPPETYLIGALLLHPLFHSIYITFKCDTK